MTFSHAPEQLWIVTGLSGLCFGFVLGLVFGVWYAALGAKRERAALGDEAENIGRLNARMDRA